MKTQKLHNIDALRALAVSVVVLFHLDIPGFSLGYLGVDLFFIISRYLMTHTMLRRREAEGHFDIGAFFVRRIKRIVPSLLITVFGSGLLALVLMSPQHLMDAAQQGLRAQFLVSNYYFYG